MALCPGLPRWADTHTHTHTRLTALCPGLPGWAGTRKVKPIWILLKQETVSGSGISWAITDNHASTPLLSFFYRLDALPAAQPTASKHWSRYQETVSDSGISWCKSAPCSRQTTTPVRHHSAFFTGLMPFLPSNSVKALKAGKNLTNKIYKKQMHVQKSKKVRNPEQWFKCNDLTSGLAYITE